MRERMGVALILHSSSQAKERLQKEVSHPGGVSTSEDTSTGCGSESATAEAL